LVAVGPEKDAALSAELRSRGADVRGYVSKEELARLYARAACLILPSRYEGFGLPVVEAMASGTPVVAAPDPALREVAGDAALFAPPAELGDAVRQAVRERERWTAAGFARVRRYTWEETARRTLEVYRELVS
jgi:glycosyltransferase involved in cell wall biosynthesis